MIAFLAEFIRWLSPPDKVYISPAITIIKTAATPPIMAMILAISFTKPPPLVAVMGLFVPLLSVQRGEPLVGCPSFTLQIWQNELVQAALTVGVFNITANPSAIATKSKGSALIVPFRNFINYPLQNQ
jgi:hypothetical protein